MRFFLILSSVLILALNTSSTNLEYPKNLDEFRYIEEVAKVPDEDSKALLRERINIVRDQLGTELMNLLGQEMDLGAEAAATAPGGEAHAKAVEAHEKSEHLKALFQRYTDMANTNADRCSDTQIADLIFLINYHSGLNGGKDLMDYLKYFTVRQIEVCKHIWDEKLKEMLDHVDEFTKIHFARLIYHMMIKMFGSAHRPYQRKNLLVLASKPSVSGILSFLSEFSDLKIDKDTIKLDYKWEDFLKSVDLILEPMCRDVCNKFTQPLEPYQLLFNTGLADNHEVKNMIPSDTDSFWEWIAGVKICCRLIADRESPYDETNMLAETYQALAKELVSVEKTTKSGKFLGIFRKN